MFFNLFKLDSLSSLLPEKNHKIIAQRIELSVIVLLPSGWRFNILDIDILM